MTSEKNILILCLLVVALCYANSVPNDFVGDDFPIVASNPAIRSDQPAAVSPIVLLDERPGSRNLSADDRPFSFCRLRPLAPMAAGFRFVNLLIHKTKTRRPSVPEGVVDRKRKDGHRPE